MAMEDFSTLPVFNLNLTLGTLEMGILISVFLFGIVTMQIFNYYNTFPEDGYLLKTLVAFVWLFEMGHTVCDSVAIYIMTISDFGQPLKLLGYPQSFNVTIMLSGFIAFCVQFFLALRVLNISGRTWPGIVIAIICWTLSALLLSFSIVASVGAMTSGTALNFNIKWGWIVSAGLSVAATVDVIITASLCFYLAQRKTGAMEKTVKLLDHLIFWTLQTGLFTSVSAVLTIIFYKTMEDNFVWLATYTFVSRLYANSFLSLLNGRSKFREPPSNRGNTSYSVSGRMAKFAPPILDISMDKSYDLEASPASIKSYAVAF